MICRGFYGIKIYKQDGGSIFNLKPFIRLLLICMLVTVVLAGYNNTAQANGGISMRAQAGLAGYARSNEYIPIQVLIENQGKPVNGRLELKSLNGQKVILYERHISLAGGAKKRVNMYLPRGTGNPYAVSFMSGDKKLAAARLRLTMLPDLEVAAGILAADPAPLKNLENMKFPMQGQHLTALNLNAEEIPEQSLLLDNLDVLIINDFSTHLLSARQIAAIEKWTQNGGLLVLTGGLAWQKTLSPLPPSLLPVKVTGSMKANSLPGIETLAGEKTKPAGPLVVSRGMVADGQVILSDDGNPLIVQKPVGSGDIVYLAFDPAQPPLDRWSGMTALWSQLLYKTDPHRIISAAASRQGGYRDYNLSWNLRNFPGIDLPTPKILTVILLTYILVLGPGIYLLLKKIDRRDWGWLAIPVLALLLFSITYIAAFKGKDRDVFTNVLSLLSLQEGGGAYSNTYVGAFAPTKTQYRVGLTGDQLISVNSEGNENHRVTIYSSSYGPMSNSEQPTQIIARVEQGDNPEVVFGESSRWSQRYLQCESILERCGNVKSSLICRNGRITGTITNNTGYSLSGAVVFNNYCRQRIGAFKPGQTVTLDLTPRAGHQSAGMIGRAIETYPIAWPRNMNYGQMNRISNLTSRLLEIASYRGEISKSPLMLAGYSSEEPHEKLITTKGGKTYYSTIVLAPLPLQMVTNGQVEILPGLIRGYITDFTGRNISPDPWGMYIDAGMVTFQMNLPFAIQGLRVDEMRLYVENQDFRQAMQMKIKVLNQQTGNWENLNYNAQGIALQHGEKYISRDGAVKIQVGTDTNMQLNGVSMSLQGKCPVSQSPVSTAADSPLKGEEGYRC